MVTILVCKHFVEGPAYHNSAYFTRARSYLIKLGISEESAGRVAWQVSIPAWSNDRRDNINTSNIRSTPTQETGSRCSYWQLTWINFHKPSNPPTIIPHKPPIHHTLTSPTQHTPSHLHTQPHPLTYPDTGLHREPPVSMTRHNTTPRRHNPWIYPCGRGHKLGPQSRDMSDWNLV